MGILLGILTFVLILVSLFLILVVLAQKSKDGGIGAALGGGAAEAAFGAETNTVLTKATIYSSVLFFVLALLLYLGRIYERAHAREVAGNALPSIAVPALPTPAKTLPMEAPKLPSAAPAAKSAPAGSVPTSTSTPTPAKKQP